MLLVLFYTRDFPMFLEVIERDQRHKKDINIVPNKEEIRSKIKAIKTGSAAAPRFRTE